MAYQESLERVVAEVIEPAAAEVDRTGAFPRKQIDALAAAGLLALTIPEELGGAGLGLRAAADVVRAVGVACGSTAMIATMHYSGTAALLAADRKPLLEEIAAGKPLWKGLKEPPRADRLRAGRAELASVAHPSPSPGRTGRRPPRPGPPSAWTG